MSKPRLYTPEDMANIIDNFFDNCTENNTIPSLPAMRLYIQSSTGLAYSTVCAYISNQDDKYKDYVDIFSRARDRRQAAAIDRLTDNKQATGMTFFLKQPENGGYTDGRSGSDSSSAIITLKIDGIGGTAAFG